MANPDGHETRYTYDEDGNKANMISPNGTITEYGYDHLNRLIAVETRSIAGTLLASYNYTLNAKGQRTHVEEQPIGRLIDYDYDAADRLIEERINDPVLGNRVISYSYDPVGNRLTKGDNGVITEYTYDDNDRLLTENGYAYTYDGNDNMFTKSGNGETWQLDYNALNQMIHADISTPQGSSTVDYAYDHDGIRIGKTINGTEVIQYVVDKNRPYAQVLEEERTHGMLSATTSYVYGDTLIARTTEGMTQYYHADGMGSVRTLSDAVGNETDSYAYDAYGMLQHHSGAGENPYLYRGEQYDADVNSYYLRARYYQTEIGRFLTTDPIEGLPFEPSSLHHYQYANANPVNVMDPSGRFGLLDTMVTTALINTVVGIAVDHNFMGLQDAYVLLAESLLPDAYIVGINANLPKELITRLHYLNHLLPYGISIPPMYTHSDIRGYEVLFSVSSAEVALFEVQGINLMQLPIYYGGALYDGAVWNLWNANNYSGPFLSGGFAGVTLFFNPNDVFMGPWGIGQDTIYSISAIPFTRRSSGAATYYTLIGQPETDKNEYEILLSLIPVACLINSLKLSLPQSVLYTATFWTQIATAKRYWNKKTNHSVLRRQTLKRRPPDFQSGPGLVLLSHYF